MGKSTPIIHYLPSHREKESTRTATATPSPARMNAAVGLVSKTVTDNPNKNNSRRSAVVFMPTTTLSNHDATRSNDSRLTKTLDATRQSSYDASMSSLSHTTDNTNSSGDTYFHSHPGGGTRDGVGNLQTTTGITSKSTTPLIIVRGQNKQQIKQQPRHAASTSYLPADDVDLKIVQIFPDDDDNEEHTPIDGNIEVSHRRFRSAGSWSPSSDNIDRPRRTSDEMLIGEKPVPPVQSKEIIQKAKKSRSKVVMVPKIGGSISSSSSADPKKKTMNGQWSSTSIGNLQTERQPNRFTHDKIDIDVVVKPELDVDDGNESIELYYCGVASLLDDMSITTKNTKIPPLQQQRRSQKPSSIHRQQQQQLFSYNRNTVEMSFIDSKMKTDPVPATTGVATANSKQIITKLAEPSGESEVEARPQFSSSDISECTGWCTTTKDCKGKIPKDASKKKEAVSVNDLRKAKAKKTERESTSSVSGSTNMAMTLWTKKIGFGRRKQTQANQNSVMIQVNDDGSIVEVADGLKPMFTGSRPHRNGSSTEKNSPVSTAKITSISLSVNTHDDFFPADKSNQFNELSSVALPAVVGLTSSTLCLDDEKLFAKKDTDTDTEEFLSSSVAMRIRETKARAIPPSPRDTPFIRPQQLLMNPDITQRNIEVTDQPVTNQPHVKTIVASMPSTAQEDEYMLTVNVREVTGIVVNCTKCNDVNGFHKNSVLRPCELQAIIGLSMQGANSVEDKTSFSETLTTVPYTCGYSTWGPDISTTNEGNASHRFLAEWAADHESEMTGSKAKIILNNLERVDKAHPLSRYLPITLDLTIALGAFHSESDNSLYAFPIGVAKLKVSNEAIRDGKSKLVDIPILSLAQSKELSRLASEDRSASADSFGVSVLETNPCKTQRNRSFVPTFTMEMMKTFHSTFGIDKDSMIRVEFSVEKNTPALYEDSLERKMNVNDASILKPPETTHIDRSLSFATIDSTVFEAIKSAHQAGRGAIEGRSIETDVHKGYSAPLDFELAMVRRNNDITNTKNSVKPHSQPRGSGSIGSLLFSCGAFTKETRNKTELTRPTLFNPTNTYSMSDASSIEITKTSNLDASFLATQNDEDSHARQSYYSYSVLSQNGVEGSNDCPSRAQIPAKDFRQHINDAQDDVKRLLTKTTDAVKEYVTDQFGKWTTDKAEELFPFDSATTAAKDTEEIAGVGDATSEAFVNGRLRMRSMSDRDSIDPIYRRHSLWSAPNSFSLKASSTSRRNRLSDNESHPSPRDKQLAHFTTRGKTFSNTNSPAVASKHNAFTTESMTHQAHLNEVDILRDISETSEKNETSTLSGTISLDDTFRTKDTQLETCSDESTRKDESVESLTAQSLVEAIAEVVSNYTSCGSVTTKNRKTWNTEIPKIIDPDASELNSIGELTAGTLEKYLELAARRQYSPPTIFSQPRFSCANPTAADHEQKLNDRLQHERLSSVSRPVATDERRNLHGSKAFFPQTYLPTENYFEEYDGSSLPPPQSQVHHRDRVNELHEDEMGAGIAGRLRVQDLKFDMSGEC